MAIPMQPYKGIREIPYPSYDMIQRWSSRDRAGEIRLVNDTGKWKFDPPLDINDLTGEIETESPEEINPDEITRGYVKYTDFNTDNFNVVTGGRVDLKVEYVTLNNFSGKGYVQPDPLPTARIEVSKDKVEVLEEDSFEVSVKLSRKPSSDVTLSITSENSLTAFASESSLVFTSSNYDIPQTITVNGVKDSNASDKSTRIRIASSSTDTHYHNLTPSYIEVAVIDIDAANFTLSTSTIKLEEGTSGTVDVRLSTEPRASVEIRAVAVLNSDLVSISPNSITFDYSNWNTQTEVTIQALEIAGDSTEVAAVTFYVYNSLDPDYEELSTRTVEVYISPEKGPDADFILSDESIQLEENSNTTSSISLVRKPDSDVTFTVTSLDSSIVSFDSAGNVSYITRTVSADLWESESSFNVYGQSVSQDSSTQIKVEITNTDDSKYAELSSKYIDVQVLDTGTPALVFSKNSIKLDEGTTDTLDIRLNSQPTDSVTITLESLDTAVAVVYKSSMTFSTSNWNTPQTVEIEAIVNGTTKDLYSHLDVRVSETNDSDYLDLTYRRLGITSYNTTIENPSEVRIGNTVWKTRNEIWDDGEFGIFTPGDAEDTERYGLVYDWESVQRLLADSPGYRLPTAQDYEELKDLYPYTVGNYLTFADGTQLFTSNIESWESSFPWQAIQGNSGLGLQPAGYLTGFSGQPIHKHKGTIPYIWASRGRKENPYYTNYMFDVLGTKYNTDEDPFKYDNFYVYETDIRTAFPVRLVKDD